MSLKSAPLTAGLFHAPAGRMMGMDIFVVLIIIATVANAARSLRFAFTTARDLNDGGYPMVGDAIHTGIFLLTATFLAAKSRLWPQYTQLLAIFSIALSFLHVVLIVLCCRAGDRARERRETRKQTAPLRKQEVS